MSPSSPKNTHIIRDLDTLRVISDPLRFQILEILAHQAYPVKQIAKKLGLASSKLYYHVNMLEEYKLIEVVETRLVSGIIEKHYQAVSPSFDIDHTLLSFTSTEGRENINTMLTLTIDATRNDMQRSLEARAFLLEQGEEPHPRRAIVMRQLSRMDDDHAEELASRLAALMHEFETTDDPQNEQAYALTIAFYPTFYYEQPGDEEEPTHG